MVCFPIIFSCHTSMVFHFHGFFSDFPDDTAVLNRDLVDTGGDFNFNDDFGSLGSSVGTVEILSK